MSTFDKLKEEVKEDYAAYQTAVSKPENRRWVRYAAYAMVAGAFLLIATCTLQSMFAPRQMAQPLDYSQPQQAYAPQPQVIQQGNSGTDMLLAAGASALAGYVVGQSRMPDGSIYQGTPAQRTVIQRTYIVKEAGKNGDNINKSGLGSTGTSNNYTGIVPKDKAKNPGDAAAEVERQKMKAEEAKRSAEASRKATLKAKLSQPSKPSGFSSFSKSASSRSKK